MSQPKTTAEREPNEQSLQIGVTTFTIGEAGLAIAVDGKTQTAQVRLDTRETATLEQFLAKYRRGEARSGFRVPFHSLVANLADDLKLTLVYRGTIYDVSPIDISLTGLLLRASTFPASAGNQVVVRIILEDYLAKLNAEVVRADSDAVALHFTDCMDGSELSPDKELSAIFARLERLFLQQRKN